MMHPNFHLPAHFFQDVVSAADPKGEATRLLEDWSNLIKIIGVLDHHWLTV